LRIVANRTALSITTPEVAASLFFTSDAQVAIVSSPRLFMPDRHHDCSVHNAILL